MSRETLPKFHVPVLVNGRSRRLIIAAPTRAVARTKAARLASELARGETHGRHGTTKPANPTTRVDGEPEAQP